jgi:hypothetical protein
LVNEKFAPQFTHEEVCDMFRRVKVDGKTRFTLVGSSTSTIKSKDCMLDFNWKIRHKEEQGAQNLCVIGVCPRDISCVYKLRILFKT